MISRSSSNINCIVRRNNNIIRSLSQAVNSSKSSSSSSSRGGGGNDNNKSAVINKVVVIDSKTQLDYSTVGRYYQTLVHKGGQGALGLRDLKHLFEKCLEPDHLKYAIKGVEMYQRKGHDFSEEINSLFIRLCIAAKNPKAAIDICSVYKYRLGAWSTPSSLGNLIESMSESMKVKGTVEDLIGLVNLITVSHAKVISIIIILLLLLLSSLKSREFQYQKIILSQY